MGEGFLADVISTDMYVRHLGSTRPHDLALTLSKLLAASMAEAWPRVTSRPAAPRGRTRHTRSRGLCRHRWVAGLRRTRVAARCQRQRARRQSVASELGDAKWPTGPGTIAVGTARRQLEVWLGQARVGSTHRLGAIPRFDHHSPRDRLWPCWPSSDTRVLKAVTRQPHLHNEPFPRMRPYVAIRECLREQPLLVEASDRELFAVSYLANGVYA